MTAPPIVVHLRGADGATFDLAVPQPTWRPAVRIAAVRAYAVQDARSWDGAKWVTIT